MSVRYPSLSIVILRHLYVFNDSYVSYVKDENEKKIIAFYLLKLLRSKITVIVITKYIKGIY